MADLHGTRDIDIALRNRAADVMMALVEIREQHTGTGRADILAVRCLAQAHELAAAAAGWQAAATVTEVER